MYEFMRNLSNQTILMIGLILGGVLVAAWMLWRQETVVPGFEDEQSQVAAKPRVLKLEDIPVDGERAYGYLKKLCDIGSRTSGSPGMTTQQELLQKHFREQGAEVELQKFSFTHPLNGTEVPGANLIARWKPDAAKRIVLCAHYDTRPFPDRDPENPRGPFVGANDGASGTAALMELAHYLNELEGSFGIDIVLFDAEEFVFAGAGNDQGKYFLGSEFFAQTYAQEKRRKYKYHWGILLDMVGDADLQIFQETHSARWSDTRPLVNSIWQTAARLGVREFIARAKYDIRDDHLPMHDIGKIPTCDIIDFDYPYWHTTADTPDKCSALSLAKVTWVVHEWLKKMK